MSFLWLNFSVSLFHVFLLIEGLGGCPAVRLYYPALAGHESLLHVHRYCFFP